MRMLMPMLLLGATANSMAGSGCLVNRPFGTTKDGTTAQVFTLTSASGVAVDVSSYGACITCLLYTSPSPRDATLSRMPSSA